VGFLSSSSAVVRFVAAPPARVDREAIAAAVTRRAFRELDGEGGAGGTAAGWVGAHDPLATSFDPTDLFFQHWLVIGFRLDRRMVPAKLLTLERRRAEAALRVERGVDRLSKGERRQVKADVEARLTTRALPTPRLFDCAWNLDARRVYFSGRSRAVHEAFTELFRATFGVMPVPLIPYLAVEHVGLTAAALQAVRAVSPARFVTDEPGPRADVPRLPLEEASL
jgi:hypothetical protein